MYLRLYCNNCTLRLNLFIRIDATRHTHTLYFIGFLCFYLSWGQDRTVVRVASIRMFDTRMFRKFLHKNICRRKADKLKIKGSRGKIIMEIYWTYDRKVL